MERILLRVGTSETPSSKVAGTNELLHERGRGGVLFTFRSP
jgi:hypothetical protein